MKKRKSILFLFCLFLFVFGQAQISKNINVITPGTLSTVLDSTELSSVTDLIVTGIIDARDFKTMRDSMPVLSKLDLSPVTIAGYTGPKGTDVYGGQVYLANTIPQLSFSKNISVGKTTLTKIILPNTATSIGYNAFTNCKVLTSVTIPNSITSIGGSTFGYCSGLSTITLPDNITSIGNFTFFGCTGLTTITIPNSVRTIGESAFQYCSKLTTIVIPSSVTSINANAFQSCTALTTITVPNSVTYVGDDAFGNTNLFNDQPDGIIYVGKCAYTYKGSTLISNSNITITDGTKQICYCAFYNCSDMTSITIPNTVTSIGYKAFYKCWGLTAITIPNSVDSIGDYAFYACIGLKSMTINAVIPPVNTSYYSFQSVADTIPLIVPQGSLNAYKTAFCWSYFKNIQEAPTSITNVSATSYSIYSQERNILVDNATNLGIQIFDISGRKVAKITKASQNEILTMPTAGVYVVKVGNRSTKVSVE